MKQEIEDFAKQELNDLQKKAREESEDLLCRVQNIEKQSEQSKSMLQGMETKIRGMEDKMDNIQHLLKKLVAKSKH